MSQVRGIYLRPRQQLKSTISKFIAPLHSLPLKLCAFRICSHSSVKLWKPPRIRVYVPSFFFIFSPYKKCNDMWSKYFGKHHHVINLNITFECSSFLNSDGENNLQGCFLGQYIYKFLLISYTAGGLVAFNHLKVIKHSELKRGLWHRRILTWSLQAVLGTIHDYDIILLLTSTLLTMARAKSRLSYARNLKCLHSLGTVIFIYGINKTSLYMLLTWFILQITFTIGYILNYLHAHLFPCALL